MLKAFQELLLDCIFPIYCIECGYPGHSLCPACLQKIPRHPNDACPFCGVESAHGLVSRNCRKSAYLDQLISFASYDEPVISRAVHELKYESVYILAEPLAEALGLALLSHCPLNPDEMMLVPIPMHPRKERMRGYNQTVKLVEHLSRSTGIPARKELLIKIKNTKSQVEIKNRASRFDNVTDSFQINPALENENLVVGRDKTTIVLVDDVATTGATLIAAASALSGRGYKHVIGLTIARQEMR